MTLPEKKEVKSILKKHVNTIHCSNNLTLVQRKLFNVLLFNAYHDLSGKAQFTISIKKLCKLIGYDSRDYKKLRKSIFDLITTAIEWNILDQENGMQQEKWRASAIVSSAKIEKGMCTYEFSSVMRELLHMPEIYGKIDLKVMTEFKSGYGLALYENCIRFQGVSSTPWLPIAIFRKLMGISDDCYKNFCDFKKRVLDIAVKEVNQYSHIKITPDINRVNKKVTGIKFKLSSNQADINKFDADENTLENQLKTEFNLSAETINEILLKYEVDYIKEKIKLIKMSSSFKSGKIRELAAYFIDAVKRDYQPSKSSKLLLNVLRNNVELQEQNEKHKEEVRQRSENKKRKDAVVVYMSDLSATAKQELMEKFGQYLQDKSNFYSFKIYKASGLNNKLIKALFDSYVIENFLSQ